MMIRVRIDAYFDTRRAVVAQIPIKVYMEGKRSQFSQKLNVGQDQPFQVAIGDDGHPRMIENQYPEHQQGGEETDHDIVLKHRGDGYVRIGEEIGALDRKAREKDEELARLRDEEQVAMNQVQSSKELRRDKFLSLISFILLSISEIGALLFVLADWFQIDSSKLLLEAKRNPLGMILLIPTAIGLYGLLLVIANKVVQMMRKEKFIQCGLYFSMLLFIGVGIGVLRGLRASSGEINWGLLLISIVVTTGLPIIAAIAEIKWRGSAGRLNQIEAPLRNLQKRIRECSAELQEIRRLRRVAVRRMEGLKRDAEADHRRIVRTRERQRDRELKAGRKLVAILVVFVEYYYFHLKRKEEMSIA
jgi:hypothetical protein